MSKFRVKLNYFDGQFLELEIVPADYQKFFDALNQNKVFWENKRGFWTNFNQIRFIEIFSVVPEKPKEVINDPLDAPKEIDQKPESAS